MNKTGKLLTIPAFFISLSIFACQAPKSQGPTEGSPSPVSSSVNPVPPVQSAGPSAGPGASPAPVS